MWRCAEVLGKRKGRHRRREYRERGNLEGKKVDMCGGVGEKEGEIEKEEI